VGSEVASCWRVDDGAAVGVWLTHAARRVRGPAGAGWMGRPLTGRAKRHCCRVVFGGSQVVNKVFLARRRLLSMHNLKAEAQAQAQAPTLPSHAAA
jgi:hypothetical protein